jgi:predicted membrane-bound dolichyl-phosphate-mannose-protein mannosyltransferase
LTGPAIGEPDPGRGAPSRTGSGDTGGVLVLLALGLIFRLIIAYLLPGSGFQNDISAFQFWANELADHGLNGFYGRGFFIDYSPGYLYVLWLVGVVGNIAGGVGDLIKIPPILGDLALGYLVWSMTRELGGSERAARLGAAIVVFNPITWLDSTIWGQVDSVGAVVLLLALRELWRDRPERAALLAALAAIIKPQLGILIPIVAVVVIRRAFWPRGGHGLDGELEPLPSTTAWERRVRGPVRVVTTAIIGLLTLVVLSWPFGLSLPGLAAQVVKAAAGYPYLTVNAFNPWALLVQKTADGRQDSLAIDRAWVCDSTIVASGPQEFRIGPIVIPEWATPATTVDRCPDGLLLGAFPAGLVGAALFLLAAALALWLIARRPDRLTLLVGVAILALEFFVLPTRVHERYLYPLVAVGSILAAVSLRWRIAYVLSGAAMFANMYVVLTTWYPSNPKISDWLGIGQTLASFWGIAIASLAQAAVLAWAFFQLREEAIEGLAEDVERAGQAGEPSRLGRWLGRTAPEPDLDDLDVDAGPAEGGVEAEGADGSIDVPPAPWPGGLLPRWAATFSRPSPAYGLAGGGAAAGRGAAGTVTPVWDNPDDVVGMGPWAWFKARLADTPLRADRSRSLEAERGARLDRLDVWVLAVLAISLLTVRMWRLDEPYQMHFDEVYHPRTATEFLQDWRYGLSHSIYEWTHPHMAKYAMALGIMAFGEDRVGATSELGVSVVDAVIEPRRDDGLDASRIEGDRLWVATGSEVRAYDLSTRRVVGTLALPGAVALAYDKPGQQLFVGTRAGEIRVVDVGQLDGIRGADPVEVDSNAFMNVRGQISKLYATRAGARLAAVLEPSSDGTGPASSEVVIIDTDAQTELGRPRLVGVTQLTEASGGRILVGTETGVAFIDPDSGTVSRTLDVGGRVHGLVAINDIENDPIYASVLTPDGPAISVVIAATGKDPRKDQTYTLPGSTAGRAYFDQASRMVHIEGSVPSGAEGAGNDTIYVIEPHGNAIYADARLPYVPSAIVLDDNQQYPSSDRQQLLAFDPAGKVASVEIGRHAFAWRVPGVIAGVLMGVLLYVLARLLFRRRAVAVILGLIVLVDGMLFAQSRIGMNDSYVGLGIVAAYVVFAALWLHPGESRRHWLAFALGMPLLGGLLGFALASKWVAAYAIGGLGILILARSALGRAVLLSGLVVLATATGYVAISVAEGQSGGNYVYLGVMVALILIAVLANVLHPVAWTTEELRLAIGTPIALGGLAILYGLSRGDAAGPIVIGSSAMTPIELGFVALLSAAALYTLFVLVGRLGFGPLAAPPLPDDPAAALDPPADPPVGWLRLGAGWGLPAIWLVVCLLVIPIALYVVSYIPWAMVENHRLWDTFSIAGIQIAAWPPGHTSQTLLELTDQMYSYHNSLSTPHPASSPWWAWTLDLKPVWFYEEGFAGQTSASIYDAGNLVAWWLGVPALAFACWQAFQRRSAALALIAIGFAVQWISWARIDRAAFQYHYYTALPFLFLALAYFLAELWHGPSRPTWLLARLAAGVAVLGPFLLWLFHRPLCAVVRVTDIVPSSQACPTLIPDVTVTPRAVAIAIVVGVGVLLLLRELLTVAEEGPVTGGGAIRWGRAAVIAAGTTIAFVLASTVLNDAQGIELTNIPVEPIALIVTLALTPVAAYVATARDSRRFVAGAIGAMGFWFVLWYPNIAALPLPAAIHNAYQGFLPTYLYPFQFWVLQGTRAAAPPLFAIGPAIMLASLTFMAVVVGYSTWSWRVALAERKRDQLAARDAAGWAGAD